MYNFYRALGLNVALTHVTGARLNIDSKGYMLLSAIVGSENGLTKYECVSSILGISGSPYRLRGYYSNAFQGWRISELLTLDSKTHKYIITDLGVKLIIAIENK